MNANEKSNVRLKRIVGVARFFKWICLLAFGCTIMVATLAIFKPDLVQPVGSANGPGRLTIHAPLVLHEFRPGAAWLYPVLWLVLVAWFCRGIGYLYRLFANLEKGILFDKDNVRCIWSIGWWMVACSMLGLLLELSKIIWQVVDIPVQIDFSDLAPDLLRGFFVIFIAWIMDEARKIREEQELTV
jgi:hypothetical protein